MDCSTPGFRVHHQLPELAQTHVHRVGDAIQPSHPLSSHFPPVFNLSQHQGLFQEVSSLHQVTKVLEFQLNEYSGLISFRMDWLDLLAVQGTLKGLLEHHSSKASIPWYSAFFMVQLSHPYMTTGKTIALTRWTFVSKVMSLLFNMLWRRQCQPTPVLLPGEFHGQRSLVGCSPWGRTESDTTEATWQQAAAAGLHNSLKPLLASPHGAYAWQASEQLTMRYD